MIVHCSHCGKKLRAQSSGPHRCPYCLNVFDVDLDALALAAPASAPPEENPACERCGARQASGICATCGVFVCDACAARDELGRATCRAHETAAAAEMEASFVGMAGGLIRRPVETFDRLRSAPAAIGRAVWFAAIAGFIGAMLSGIYQLLLPPAWADPSAALLHQVLPMIPLETSPMETLQNIIFAPLGMIVAVFFEGLLFHAALRLVGAGTGGWRATVKVMAYSALALFAYVFPVVGFAVFYVWSAVLTVIGAARMHRVGYGRALAAMAIVFLVFALLGMALVLSAPVGPELPAGGELV